MSDADARAAEEPQDATAGNDAYVAGRDINNYNYNYYGSAVPASPRLLPRDVPCFTGRDGELAQLTALAGGGRAVVTVIGGAAGVGKTALAIHAAYQLLDEFPDAHLYADLRGYTDGQDPAAPGEVLEVFLRRFSVPAEEIPATVEERSGMLRQLLAGRQVLMVLDNARTEEQVRPLLPGVGGSLVLVTSRSVLPGLEAVERISLDILPEDQAVAMLARVTGDARAGAEPQAVAEVARLCGRLPLALRIAGQLLAAHPAWPVSRLAGMLTSERDRLARLRAGDLQVRAAFAVSYAQLVPEDARLFRLLGLHPGPNFDAWAAAALAGAEPDAAGLVMDRLAGTHLVTEDTAGWFGFQNLLRLFARATCQEADSLADQEAAEARLAGHYAGRAGVLGSCVDPQQRPAAEQAAQEAGVALLPMRKALAIFQAERPGLLAALGLAAERGWDEQVRQLSISMHKPLTILRYLDDLITVHETALDSACRTSDRHGEGMARNNLGEAYRELRQFEKAIECHQQSLEIFRETGDRDGEGTALNNLGNDCADLRQFEEAVDWYQQALEISWEADDRVGEGQILGNLGNAYAELRQFEKAIDSYQKSLKIRRDAADRHGAGVALGNLGNAYAELRQFEEAADCHQQALEIFQEAGDWHAEGMALNNLGNAYQKLRQHEEAANCYQQALETRPETDDRHRDGQTLNNLGNAYQDLRRFEEAVHCYQQSLKIRRDAGDRVGESGVLGNLGTVCAELRQFEEAVDWYQQALEIFWEAGDRLGEGQTLGNLGIAYRELRQPGRAIKCWQEAAAAMRDAGEPDEARRLDQLVESAQPQPRSRRRWWGLRLRSSS